MIKHYLSLFERDGILVLSFASLTEYSVTFFIDHKCFRPLVA